MATPFEGYIAWPYLDFGRLGVEKRLEGFDLICTGTCRVSIGYDQSDFDLATDAYALDGDTLPANLIPFPVTAPSFQFRIAFNSNQEWELEAASLYLSDQGRPP